MSELEKRRRARSAIEQADLDMENIDKRMKANGRTRPMQASPEQLAVSRQQEITLNVEWVATALTQARQDGWKACIDAFQPVIDYANNHPDGWRNAFDSSVTDVELRAALSKALEAI